MPDPDELRLLQAIHTIQTRYTDDGTTDAVLEDLLATLLGLTGSEYGLIGDVLTGDDGVAYLEPRAFANIAWDDATRRFYAENAPTGLEFANLENLLGTVMTTGGSVISNDPSHDERSGDLVSGHPSLDASLGLPLHHRGQMIGMVGVANRAGGYDQTLVDFLTPFVTTCAAITKAYRDDREWRRLEGEVRQNEERTQLIADVSSDGKFIVDIPPNGETHVWIDSGYERLAGYSSEEVDQVGLEALLHPDDRKRVVAYARAIVPGETARCEFRLVRPDDSVRWVHCSQRLQVGLEPGHRRYAGAIHDVTDRVEAELERRRAEENLRHIQKTDAIGTLAGGVAHDFNNALYVILGNAELALQKLGEDDGARKNLNEILAAARRGADITNRILQYSRVGTEPQTACDVGAVVRETREFLAAALPSSTQLVFDGQWEGLFVPVGASDLQQVLVNLCTNASHAMSVGGEVHVDFEEVPRSSVAEPPQVRMSVRDSGHGMSASLVQHIFEPYFTTKPRGKGTGLGLAVVQGIVSAAGGTIDVTSEVEGGSTFRVHLPAVAPASSEEAAAPALGHGQENVLFVDDEPRVARLGQEILESLGYSVEALTNSRDALDRFGANPGHYDIVVTDQTMPHLTGDAFARAVLRIRPDMPIVLCTGFSERLEAGEWGELGIHSFLKKPFSLEQLGTTVRRALDESRGAQPWQRS
ncbi:MAG: ATP-binding protein [Candidatus Binatia bacterium]|nr:ATP-binding protein [Candidatus Binatia bacterium]